MGKSKGGKILGIIGFAFGVANPGVFGLGSSQWLLGGLYGASIGTSLWSMSHKPDKGSTSSVSYNFDQIQNQLDSNNRIPIIYGTRKWGGQQTYHRASSDKQSLTKDIVWCEGEVDSISDVRANDIQFGTKVALKFTRNYIQESPDGTPLPNSRGSYRIQNGYFDYKSPFVGFGRKTLSFSLSGKTVGDLVDWLKNEGFIVLESNDSLSASGLTETSDYVLITESTTVYHNLLPGCSYTFSNGSPSQAAPNNYGTVGGYKNVAWSRCSLKTSDQLTGGNPTVTAVIRGMKIWDTRTKTKAYSSNPAMCVRDYLLSKRYGAGHFITVDMLDEDSFREIADYNDQLVTTRVPTTLANANAINSKINELQSYLTYHSAKLSTDEQENITAEIVRLQQALIDIQSKPVEYTLEVAPRHSLNIIIAETKSHVEILQDMFAVFGGFLVFTNNKISLRCEKETPVSYAFTDDTIIEGSLDHTQYPIDQTPNRFSVRFYDPDNQWTGVKVIVEDTVEQKECGKIINKDVDLIGCTSQSQALRLARLYRDKMKLCSIVIQFQTATMAMHLEPGDVVTVSKKIFPDGIEQWLFQDMPFRILEISEHKGIYSIKAEQYNGSIYNDSLGAQIQVKNYIEISNPVSGDIPDVTSFEVKEYGWMNKDGTHISTIECAWDELEYQFFRHYVLSISTDDENWKTIANTLSNSFVITNVEPGKQYNVRLQVQNSAGRLSTGVSQDISIVGKDNPPGNVTGFSVVQTGENISFTWSLLNEPDVRTYEIRTGSSWHNSELITRVSTVPYLLTAPENGTFNFWIKAIDNFGNYSEKATGKSVNIFGLKPKNVILQGTVDLSQAITTNVYVSPWGYYEIETEETIGSSEYFADMFNSGNTFLTAKVITPAIDLGENVMEDESYYIDPWGNIKIETKETIGSGAFFADMFNSGNTYVDILYVAETFLSITLDYNATVTNSIDIKYQTSMDGLSWSDEVPYHTKQFFGRYVRIVLYPKTTQDLIHLKSISYSIDVTDVEDIIEDISIDAQKTYIKYNHKFFATPSSVALYVSDSQGNMAIHRKTEVTNTGFYLEIFNLSGNLIAGKLDKAVIRGY